MRYPLAFKKRQNPYFYALYDLSNTVGGVGLLFAFLDLHYGNYTFDGRIQIGCRGGRSLALIPALTTSLSELSSRLETFSFSFKSDYYITANSVSGIYRQSKDLFAFHNIVIDLDCHESTVCNLDFQLILWRLQHDIFSTLIPCPTSIVYTGRGLQFWWAIGGASVKLKFMYDYVLNFYLSVINSALDSFLLDDFTHVSVDFTASKNPVGYFRLPYTNNTKVNKLVEYNTNEKIYSLNQLYHDVLTVESEQLNGSVATSCTVALVPKEGTQAYVSLANSRVEAYRKLRDTRISVLGLEERNNYCFMVYNALAPCYGHNIAFHQMKHFNDGFLSPMTEKELNACICTAKKKLGYQYRTEKILDFLHITKDEAMEVGLLAVDDTYLNKRQKTKAQNFTKKEHRNLNIIHLFEQGTGIGKIAQQLNLSDATVSKVLKENQYTKSSYRFDKIIELQKNGLTQGEIAKELSCSLRTVQRELKKQITNK